MQTIKVKPQQGLLVRDPETRKQLKATGEEKPRNVYWLRRIKDGSVIEVTAKATKKAATKEVEQ